MATDPRPDPFSIRATFSSWSLQQRLLVVAFASVGVALLIGTAQYSPAGPGLYRPPPLEAHELVHRWCAGGTLISGPPFAHCILPEGRALGPERHLTQTDLERFASEQPRRWPRPRSPHPYTWAVLLGLLGLAVWRQTRPVRVGVTSHGVVIGSNRFPRHEIAGCTLGRFGGWPTLVIHTRTWGRFTSRPIRRPAWEIEDLCDEIRSLIVDEDEAKGEVAAQAEVHDRLDRVARWRGRSADHTPREPL